MEESIRQGNPKPFIEEAVLQVSDWGFSLKDLQVHKKCQRGVLSWLRSLYSQAECELKGFLGPIHIWQVYLLLLCCCFISSYNFFFFFSCYNICLSIFFVKMKYYYAFIIISFILNIHHDILSFDILNGKVVDKYFRRFIYIYIYTTHYF